MQIVLEPAAILSPECQNWQRFLNQTSTTTCILKQLFLRYNYQLQMSKCRIVFLLSFILFPFLSCLPPWRNRVAGLPGNTGCNYRQQCRRAMNVYGSMHKAQECKLKVGRLMKWDLPEKVSSGFPDAYIIPSISVKEWVVQTLSFNWFLSLWF